MIVKHFIEGESEVEVEFIASAELPEAVTEVFLAGNFNDWLYRGENQIPMERDGDRFRATLRLEVEKEYEFLYVVFTPESPAQPLWIGDWHPDKFNPGALGGSNSVVLTFDFNKGASRQHRRKPLDTCHLIEGGLR